MTLFNQIKQYCTQDIRDIISGLNGCTGKRFNVADIKYICDADKLENSDEDGTCNVVVTLAENINKVILRWRYTTAGDNIYVSKDVRDVVAEAKKKYDRLTQIKSATAIMAADDDFNDEFFNGTDDSADGILYDDSDTIGDNIDALSDRVQDLQDSVDDVEEDDVDIELDNNIDNHYIAECEGCHGVFISAMIESDQVVEKITGTCPLCEKETDQYLKWIVKAVEK